MASFAYRDAPSVEAPHNQVTYGNHKFHLVVSHTFKSKRGLVAPADLAFMQLVLVATLSGKTLSSFPDAEGTYRAFLLFAKEHLGRHVAVVAATDKKRSFVLGKRCVFVALCFLCKLEFELACVFLTLPRVVRARAGIRHDCFTTCHCSQVAPDPDDETPEPAGDGASDSLPSEDEEPEEDEAEAAGGAGDEDDEDEDDEGSEEGGEDEAAGPARTKRSGSKVCFQTFPSMRLSSGQFGFSLPHALTHLAGCWEGSQEGADCACPCRSRPRRQALTQPCVNISDLTALTSLCVSARLCVCVCVCVCARAFVRLCFYVCMCVCVCV